MSRKSSREGVVHRCHLIGCRTVTTPRMLFCKPHWDMLPGMLQRPILFSVSKRGPRVDATWAPWWRAQARAHVYLLRKIYLGVEQIATGYGETQTKIVAATGQGLDAEKIAKIEKKDADFVAYLERKKEN